MTGADIGDCSGRLRAAMDELVARTEGERREDDEEEGGGRGELQSLIEKLGFPRRERARPEEEEQEEEQKPGTRTVLENLIQKLQGDGGSELKEEEGKGRQEELNEVREKGEGKAKQREEGDAGVGKKEKLLEALERLTRRPAPSAWLT
eukprot:815920-Rhodomonas_salina.2